ncbi:unnamed protein product, partial [Mesorhabditis belari]|uniref:Uncharacterized protein n=1 Tax=Mesorhabditis belari TaxID=2138241 RepID=A0AAF3EHR7_9BILA
MSLLSSCLALLFAVLLAFASVSMVNADPVPLCDSSCPVSSIVNLKNSDSLLQLLIDYKKNIATCCFAKGYLNGGACISGAAFCS